MTISLESTYKLATWRFENNITQVIYGKFFLPKSHPTTSSRIWYFSYDDPARS